MVMMMVMTVANTKRQIHSCSAGIMEDMTAISVIVAVSVTRSVTILTMAITRSAPMKERSRPIGTDLIVAITAAGGAGAAATIRDEGSHKRMNASSNKNT